MSESSDFGTERDKEEDEDKLQEEVRETAADLIGAKKEPKLKGIPEAYDVSRVFMHSKRGTLHYGHRADDKELACGKGLTPIYHAMGPKTDGMWPICGDCMPENVSIEK